MQKPDNINPDHWQDLLSLSQKLGRKLKQLQPVLTPAGEIDWKQSIEIYYLKRKKDLKVLMK